MSSSYLGGGGVWSCCLGGGSWRTLTVSSTRRPQQTFKEKWKSWKKNFEKKKSYEIENINFEQINIDSDKEYFQVKISVINEGVSMYFFVLTAAV